MMTSEHEKLLLASIKAQQTTNQLLMWLLIISAGILGKLWM